MRVQLLGSDPHFMAANARRALRHRPAGIDINFGCPAPTVFRHRGGSALLGEPQLLYDIVSAVRAVVPVDIPFTAKMRLGIEDDSLAVDCARAIEAGGADELIVHGRTKVDGYRPPARWAQIDRVRAAVNIPVSYTHLDVYKRQIKGTVIQPVFEDWKSGRYKIISFFAKRARGLMTRYAVVNRLDEPEGLKDFGYDDYAFAPEASDDKRWVFRRRQD